MAITTHLGRLALCGAIVAGLAGCKKDKQEPAADPKGSAVDKGSGSGSASGTGTGTATGSGSGSGSGSAKVPEGASAMLQIKGAMADADGKPDPAPSNPLMAGGGGGALGGVSAALGGLFGGGGKAAAERAQMDKMDKMDKPSEPPPEGDLPPEDESPAPDPTDLSKAKLPPAGEKGGDCAAVADRVYAIVMAIIEVQFSTMDAETRKMVEATVDDEIKKMKDQILTMCDQQSWPQELKDCVLVSADLEALQGCEQYVTEEMRNAPPPEGPPEEPPPPATPAPAWTGGNDCAAVGQRVAQLAMHQAGDLPDDTKANLEEAMKEAVDQITEMCTAGSWPDDTRACFFTATSIQDADVCFEKIGDM